MDFDGFFQSAFGETDDPTFGPFDYQRRLAAQNWPDLLDVPTGMGKTAAVTLAWLWKRGWRSGARTEPADESTPRRLVWCLPMRVLVEQTEGSIRAWLKNLGIHGDQAGDGKVSVHILMGGESDLRSWAEYPEEDMILIGTQDMLLSRALMRGYGMSRYQWPIHFGLLNQDCMWVMDEIQLMGPGLWTTSQLDWMRQKRFPSIRPCRSLWMSATIGTSFLKTTDRVSDGFDQALTCCPDLEKDPKTQTRREAKRPVSWFKTPKGPLAGQFAAEVESKHEQGTLSLVVCNTVEMARSVFDALEEQHKILLTSRFRREDRERHEQRLLEFEMNRRRHHGEPIPDDPGLICVCTQVIEAGVDISAHRLWSELAPWPSVIQRLGRLNRDGKDQGAQAYFWKTPKEGRGKQKRIGPYAASDIELASKLFDVLIPLSGNVHSWQALLSLHSSHRSDVEKALQPRPTPIPRASDLHSLFSTEPDVHGGFTDISRFVRDTDPDADVTVFWRDWPGTQPPTSDELDGPDLKVRQEGCSVSVSKIVKLLKDRRAGAWMWNDKRAHWDRISPPDLRPGMVVMLHRDVGGYQADTGWTGNAADKLADLPSPGHGRSLRDDPLTDIGYWASLDVHLKDTRREAGQLCDKLDIRSSDPHRAAVVEAAGHHDLGKAHPKWLEALPARSVFPDTLLAKCPRVLAIDTHHESDDLEAEVAKFRSTAVRLPDERRPRGARDVIRQKWAVDQKLSRDELDRLKRLAGVLWAGHAPFRPGMRHEAASALAMWQRYREACGEKPFPALAVYLAATHHGKIRTVMRSLNNDGLDVFGVPREPHELVVGSEHWPLNFDIAKDGATGEWQGNEFVLSDSGWTGLVADLLGPWDPNDKTSAGVVPDSEPRKLGPFALAYLEALVCIADWRASDRPSQSTKPGEVSKP
ncbi:MAG TPA: DEAD/DEAH box helicase [Rhodanobacteraceae bacterium]|nr:DEAD/DEAH box helicase [Rhodanobacteraceae bacterium]